MARKGSSGRWLREHHADLYVKQAREQGYRARSAFKLEQIQERDRILKPGMTVVDLGAAPGGWTQVAVKALGGGGAVFALDILPMEPVDGADFIQGDFREADVARQLGERMAGRRAGLVMSDMAPNMSGMKSVDQARGMYLAELALEFAREHLESGGDFLVKVFQGEGFDAFLADMKQSFGRVVTRKPKASRARSSELYLLARDYRL